MDDLIEIRLASNPSDEQLLRAGMALLELGVIPIFIYPPTENYPRTMRPE